jgi:hypothetical protein
LGKKILIELFLAAGLASIPDEFYEAVTLIQTQRMKPFPVIMVGKEYWKGMVDWIRGRMLKEGCISPEDLGIYKIVDTPKSVVSEIKKFYDENKDVVPNLLVSRGGIETRALSFTNEKAAKDLCQEQNCLRTILLVLLKKLVLQAI